MKTMAATLAAENIPQAISSQYLRSFEPISDISHRLDEIGTQLGPEPADVHVNHVAPGIERQTPHVRQELFPGAHFTLLAHQMLKEEEFTFGQAHGPLPGIGHPANQIEGKPSSREDPRSRRRGRTGSGPAAQACAPGSHGERTLRPDPAGGGPGPRARRGDCARAGGPGY